MDEATKKKAEEEVAAAMDNMTDEEITQAAEGNVEDEWFNIDEESWQNEK